MVPVGPNVSASFKTESCPNCSSSTYPEVDVTKAVLFGLVMVVFVVFGVLGNILVILSVVCHRHLRSVTHCFIANLAAADLLLSAAVLPFSATFEALGGWVFGRPFCHAWAALDVLCCTASILSLCLISVDRYLAVTYPLRYPSIATGGRGLAALVALWALSAAISIGPVFGWKEPDPEDETVCRITQDPGYALFSALGSFYVPLAVILVMYCRVYVIAKRETRALAKGGTREGLGAGGVALRIHRGNASSEGRVAAEEAGVGCRRPRAYLMKLSRKFSREQKAAKTLGIVVGCFVICWLPFFVVLPFGAIFPSYKPSDTVFKIAFWLGYFNSCINPIIYPCFSHEFKKAFQNVLHCRCLRRRRPDPKPKASDCAEKLSPGPTGGDLKAPCLAFFNGPPSFRCCRTSSASSSSLGAQEHSQSGPVQNDTQLKAWCFSARETAPQQNPSTHGSAKVLRLSLGVTGEDV